MLRIFVLVVLFLLALPGCGAITGPELAEIIDSFGDNCSDVNVTNTITGDSNSVEVTIEQCSGAGDDQGDESETITSFGCTGRTSDVECSWLPKTVSGTLFASNPAYGEVSVACPGSPCSIDPELSAPVRRDHTMTLRVAGVVIAPPAGVAVVVSTGS